MLIVASSPREVNHGFRWIVALECTLDIDCVLILSRLDLGRWSFFISGHSDFISAAG